MTYKDNNPKGIVGASKVPLHLVPRTALHFLARALEDGARKYGPYNWREHPICASTYVAARDRHESAWWDGQDVAKDSDVHHLAHIMACCAIELDAMSIGMWIDDRPPPGATPRLQDEYLESKQARIVQVTDTSTPHGQSHPMAAEALRDEYSRDDNSTGV